jgi:PD-(D/E)XK nuclease superfamily
VTGSASALQTKNREATGSLMGIYQGKPNAAALDELWDERNPDANFLSDAIAAAVEHRISNPVTHQQLEQRRLRRHMLGSMPMCFNLFGGLSADLTRLRTSDGHCSGSMPRASRSAWSGHRGDSQEYTGDQTAFDVALAPYEPSGGHCHHLPAPVLEGNRPWRCSRCIDEVLRPWRPAKRSSTGRVHRVGSSSHRSIQS